MSRPLRIAHVYNWLNPANGGPPRVIAGLVAGQRALGHSVRLISSDPAGAEAVDAFLGEHLKPLPQRDVVRPKFFLPVVSFPTLRRALSAVDIAHLHGIWPSATLLASQVCRLLKVPYVLAPHGSLHHGALAEKRPRKLVGIHLLGYGAMVRHASALHTLNEDEAAGASTVRLPERIAVIPNGVFPEDFAARPEPGAFRARIPGLGSAPFVLFLSRLHWGKGCDLLAAAFEEVARARPDVHLVVIGDDQGGAAMFREGATRGGYGGRLHLVGPVHGPQKHAAYCDAAVYCLPSRHEGFSMAVTEALAWGRPVVITEACHFPLVSTEQAGWEVAGTPAAIAAGLIEALAEPARAEARGARGRALVLTRFTWPEIAAQTVALYREVLGA